MELLDRKTVRYTQTTPEEAAQAECLIIDCFGLLSSIYHYGELAYVGGGFGVGIHNVLEAAVWDIPVIFGPNNKRFQEAQGLLASQGGREINDRESFRRVMTTFMKDSTALSDAGTQAGRFVNGLSGATDKILQFVFPLAKP